MSAPEDLPGLLAAATALLDGVADRFCERLGAPGSIDKGATDFATEVDLELERTLTAALLERTGIPVHGEEFGGPDLTSGTAWVLDPVDGTANYSAGLPLCGILLALVHDAQPLLGLTWLPLLGERFTAVAGGALHRNGVALPPLAPTTLGGTTVVVGSMDRRARGRYPGPFRHAAMGALSETALRVRLLGATGVDLAWTASGALGGSVTFGHHPWDNAAGVALVRAAGGVVTDLAGDDWRIDSPSVLAAAPGVHGELLALLAGLGEPRDVPRAVTA